MTVSDLSIRDTPIPGLLVFNLPLRGDSRGWFKENWQREKMLALGLPDFIPVQNNMSYNAAVGATRGLHAEPWDKLVSVANGKVFGAWVDLRAGDSFGAQFNIEITPSVAVFVPCGVANGYQALESGTTYSYLVNAHWSADAQSRYTYVSLADPALAIPWPLAIQDALISDADKKHPVLSEVTPIMSRHPYVIGAGGQLGNQLLGVFPNAIPITERDLDITDSIAVNDFDWSNASAILNAAAYVSVDDAETIGRKRAWAVNATGVGNLAAVARARNIPLVHISSDYVFDGTGSGAYSEEDLIAPLGVYGQTKAAGDLLAATVPRHYILRTTWLIGDGKNFVRTMNQLAKNGKTPCVIDDQRGRLTFTEDLARAVKHLLENDAPVGIYNVTGAGDVMSWADIAKQVYELSGYSAASVTAVSTADYSAGKSVAPRPLNSEMSLDKIIATGFNPRNHMDSLKDYLFRL